MLYMLLLFQEVQFLQNSRLLEMLLLLMEKGNISAPKLAEQFDVSVRTIYRDIDALSAAGVPVYATTGRNGGVQLMDNFVLDKSVLTEVEKKEILLGLQALLAVPFLGEGTTLKKLAVLFDQRTNWIDVDFSRWGSLNREDAQKFETIKEAVFNEKAVEFQYVDAGGSVSERTLDPLKLVYKQRDWYLYGYCHLRKDFRLFKTTRINELRILTQSLLQEYSAAQRTGYLNEEWMHTDIEVKLWFSRLHAHRVYDVFEFSCIENMEDGIYVTAPIPEDEWLYSYLLSFGADVRVIQPEHIKKELKNRQKQAYEAE